MRREEGEKRERQVKPISTVVTTFSVEIPEEQRYSSIPDLMWREEGEKRQGGEAPLHQYCHCVC
jgi:hypothetical protein